MVSAKLGDLSASAVPEARQPPEIMKEIHVGMIR